MSDLSLNIKINAPLVSISLIFNKLLKTKVTLTLIHKSE